MNQVLRYRFCVAIWIGILVMFSGSIKATGLSPNVVILLADDLGSADIVCYGGPVRQSCTYTGRLLWRIS